MNTGKPRWIGKRRQWPVLMAAACLGFAFGVMSGAGLAIVLMRALP